MREMRGEVGKKTLKKRWIISHFYDVTGIKSRTDWALSFLLYSNWLVSSNETHISTKRDHFVYYYKGCTSIFLILAATPLEASPPK
jgi:hypothetical protein